MTAAGVGTVREDGRVNDSWAGALLEVRGVGVTRGRARLLDAVDLVAEPRSWTAVVGPNGAGKSTLLRCVAGVIKHDGAVLVDGNGGRVPVLPGAGPGDRLRPAGAGPARGRDREPST